MDNYKYTYLKIIFEGQSILAQILYEIFKKVEEEIENIEHEHHFTLNRHEVVGRRKMVFKYATRTKYGTQTNRFTRLEVSLKKDGWNIEIYSIGGVPNTSELVKKYLPPEIYNNLNKIESAEKTTKLIIKIFKLIHDELGI
jgi:hypothetical protein